MIVLEQNILFLFRFSATRACLILCFISLYSNALILNCSYDVVTWTLVGSIYTCTGSIQFDGDDRNVTSVTGNHTQGNSNINVLAIALSTQPFPNGAPTNLESFFPNLTVFSMSSTALAQFSRSDIAPFFNLRALILFNNQLRALESDLFVDTPSVEYINLGSNRLRHLGPNVFTHLNLVTLRLNENDCIDNFVNNNTAEIDSLTWEASVKCPPTFQQLENEILNGPTFQNIIDPLTSRVAFLENQVAELERVANATKENE